MIPMMMLGFLVGLASGASIVGLLVHGAEMSKKAKGIK